MNDEHTPSPADTPKTETSRRTPGWLRDRKARVAGITALVLAGGWAVSSTPPAQAAYDHSQQVDHQLDQVDKTLDRWTSDHPSGRGVKNTAPKDAAFQRSLDNLVSKDGMPGGGGVRATVRRQGAPLHGRCRQCAHEGDGARGRAGADRLEHQDVHGNHRPAAGRRGEDRPGRVGRDVPAGAGARQGH